MKKKSRRMKEVEREKRNMENHYEGRARIITREGREDRKRNQGGSKHNEEEKRGKGKAEEERRGLHRLMQGVHKTREEKRRGLKSGY